MATTWQQSQSMHEYTGAGGLLAAIKAGEELEDDDWAKLYDTATPYQRRCARLILDPTCAPHGVASTYTNWGCRCTPCREAANGERGTRKTNEDFRDDAPAPDGEPEVITRLKKQRQEGLNLTDKALNMLAEWEAKEVI